MDRINSNAVCEIAKANERLAKRIEELEKELEHYRWIPVSERLPEEDGDYLVTMVTPGYLSGQPYTNWLYWDAADCDWLTDEAGDSVPEQETEVIAWMSLPEPYRPEALRETGAIAGQDVAEQLLQSAT